MKIFNKFFLKYLEIKSGGYINMQLWNQEFHKYVEKKYNIKVGMGSYGNLNFPSGTEIGNYCSIADGCKYLSGNHPYDHVSTAACFYNPELGFVTKEHDIKRTALSIGHDVWIGANVLITNKCTKIGNGAVIGAGSVVTKNVEPYTIVAGNPARIIKKRFDKKIIDMLEASKWYELSPYTLCKYIDYIDDPEKFLKLLENEINDKS